MSMLKKLILAVALPATLTSVAQTATEAASPLFTDDGIDSTQTDSVESYQRYTGNNAMDAFINAPLEVFPTVDRMTRMDMADYFNSGSPKPSKNSFKGDCRILSASDSQVTFTTTDVSDTELSLLPMKSDTIIMVINTLKTPAEDSSVRFYSYPDWTPVKEGMFMVPTLDDWRAEGDKTPGEDLENAVPFILARISFKPESGELVLENRLGDYLPEEAKKIALGALSGKLTYKWNGSRMVKVK